jgi:hypothetical protein
MPHLQIRLVYMRLLEVFDVEVSVRGPELRACTCALVLI